MEAATATAAGNKPTPWNPHREPEQEQGREKKGQLPGNISKRRKWASQANTLRERKREIDRER